MCIHICLYIHMRSVFLDMSCVQDVNTYINRYALIHVNVYVCIHMRKIN